MNKHDGQIWFTSDPHFNHGNIIKYSMRTPFMNKAELEVMTTGTKEEQKKLRISRESINLMNTTMIDNINSVVDAGDHLVCLGDWVMGKNVAQTAKEFRDRIHCKRIDLIWGNHDKHVIGNNFDRTSHLHRYKWEWNGEVIRLVACHYAMRIWDGSHRGVLHLYGHSHGALKEDLHARSFDCGVDSWGYMPINTDTILKKMATKTFKPIDHHGKRDQK